MKVPQNVKRIEPPYYLATPLMGIYPNKLKSVSQKGICTPTYLAALFRIAMIRKTTKRPLTEEWIKKMWYTLYIQ